MNTFHTDNFWPLLTGIQQKAVNSFKILLISHQCQPFSDVNTAENLADHKILQPILLAKISPKQIKKKGFCLHQKVIKLPQPNVNPHNQKRCQSSRHNQT